MVESQEIDFHMILLTAFYENLLNDLNYFSVTVLMTIESSVIPFPSEVVVPPAGYMAAEGTMWLPWVIFFATLGSVLGAVCNYVVSYYVGRPVVYRFVNSRLGHLCLLNQEKMERAEAYFDRKGAIATLLGRLLPGIRQIISIPAGLAKMHFGRFVLYTAIGSSIWNCILAVLGWYLQKLVPLSRLNEAVTRYERPIVIALVALVAVIVMAAVWKNWKKRK
jgi:membrane protein DedA with SNARE-associated domain